MKPIPLQEPVRHNHGKAYNLYDSGYATATPTDAELLGEANGGQNEFIRMDASTVLKSAMSYFYQVNDAHLYQSSSTVYMIIAGVSNSFEWQMLVVDIRGKTASPEMKLEWAKVDPDRVDWVSWTYSHLEFDECKVHVRCLSVLKFDTYQGNIYAAMRTMSGLVMARFSFLDPVYENSNAQTLIHGLDPNVKVRCSSIAMDSYAGRGFLSCTTADQPSVLYKFKLSDEPVIAGTVNFELSGFDREVVTDLSIDSSSRIMTAVVSAPDEVRLDKLAMWAIEDIYPPMADTRGDSPITVTGEGFVGARTHQCRFGLSKRDGTFVSDTKVMCLTPPGGDEECLGYTVELAQFKDDSYTDNQIRLRRAPTPSVSMVR
eukprot:gene7060-2659_t